MSGCFFSETRCISSSRRAVNVHSRAAAIDNVDAWSHQNNLQLDHKKCVEILFTSSRIRSDAPLPPPLPDIAQVSSLKILGVTVSSRLSVADHVQNVVSSCAQTLRALRLLRDMSKDCVTQRCTRSTELPSSPGCCTLPAPGGASSRPQTGSALRDFYAVVCVPVTAAWTSLRPPSWSKTLMISCSTGSSTSAATLFSHFFPITALTSGDMTSYYLADSIHYLTPILLLGNFLKTLIDVIFYFSMYFRLLQYVWLP